MSTKKFITLDDVDNNLGNDGNMPGIIPTLIYGYQEDVATWPDEPDGTVTELTLDAAGKLTGDVIMKPGTRAYSLDFTEDVGTFKMNTVGEVDSIHWKYELDFIKAKIQAKILGFANAAASKPSVGSPNSLVGRRFGWRGFGVPVPSHPQELEEPIQSKPFFDLGNSGPFVRRSL